MRQDDLPPITAVERLHLEPGDIVVVHVEARITAAVAAEIKRRVATIVEPHDVIVLSESVTLSVIESDLGAKL